MSKCMNILHDCIHKVISKSLSTSHIEIFTSKIDEKAIRYLKN
jgi:hypothetical protein